MALWVFPIHLYALLVPFALISAILNHRLLLGETIFNVDLLFLASGILILGSLFEIIQNHIDRWFITAQSASGNGFSLIDGLFTFLILLGQALILIALVGQNNLIKMVAIACVISTPILYYKRMFVFFPTSLIGIINIIATFIIFKDWIIFLQLITIALTILFFNQLIKTGNQFYHGLTTFAASSGIWFLVIVINNSSYG